MSPVIQQINEHFASYASLSNDELRANSARFKARIKDHTADITSLIQSKKKKLKTYKIFMRRVICIKK